MTEASSPVKKHLRLLYRDHQTYNCFEGPYQACKHPPDNDLFDYEKQVVSDNEVDESEDESGWESGSNKDELEDDELEDDKLEDDELEGDRLKEDKKENGLEEGKEKDKHEPVDNMKG